MGRIILGIKEKGRRQKHHAAIQDWHSGVENKAAELK